MAGKARAAGSTHHQHQQRTSNGRAPMLGGVSSFSRSSSKLVTCLSPDSSTHTHTLDPSCPGARVCGMDRLIQSGREDEISHPPAHPITYVPHPTSTLLHRPDACCGQPSWRRQEEEYSLFSASSSCWWWRWRRWKGLSALSHGQGGHGVGHSRCRSSSGQLEEEGRGSGGDNGSSRCACWTMR